MLFGLPHVYRLRMTRCCIEISLKQVQVFGSHLEPRANIVPCLGRCLEHLLELLLLGKLQSLFICHSSLHQVTLIAAKVHFDILFTVLTHFVKPLVQSLKRLIIAYVISQENEVGIPVEDLIH